jgi:hypothetical protein
MKEKRKSVKPMKSLRSIGGCASGGKEFA